MLELTERRWQLSKLLTDEESGDQYVLFRADSGRLCRMYYNPDEGFNEVQPAETGDEEDVIYE